MATVCTVTLCACVHLHVSMPGHAHMCVLTHVHTWNAVLYRQSVCVLHVYNVCAAYTCVCVCVSWCRVCVRAHACMRAHTPLGWEGQPCLY